MKRITVPGKLHFNFRIKKRLIDKLRQGINVFSESISYNTVHIDPLEVPIKELLLKDQNTVIIPPLELQLKIKLTLIRDKRR